jgi:RNA polymerase sigma-B factor
MKVKADIGGRSERDTATGRLLRAYQQDGDTRARDRLVQLYLSLVETFAHRYARPGAEYDDLVQAGSIGLLNAIERFDPRRGDEFAAFAVPTIVGEIKRHIRDRANAVKLPRALQEAGARLPRVQEELTGKLDREPSDRELAAELGLEPDELTRLREALRTSPTAEDTASEDVDAELDLSDERVMLAGAFHVLDETERSIVYLRFVRDLGPSEAAGELGLSERQLERRTQAALAKLRGELERGSAPRPSDPAPTMSQPEQPPKEVEPEPAPKAKAAHSGRLLLRMPQSLHGELAQAAEREEVSLNQFITNSLAAVVGWGQPHTEAPDEEAAADEQPAPKQQGSPPRWLRAALVTNIVVVALAGIVAVILLLVAWQQGF